MEGRENLFNKGRDIFCVMSRYTAIQIDIMKTKEGKRIGSANQNKLMINLSVYSKINQVDSVNGTLIETKECCQATRYLSKAYKV